MTEQNQASGDPSVRQTGEGLAAGEKEQLVYALEARFTTHREAAAAVVREAERDLAEAQEQLEQAERAAADTRYVSDPLVFMRASVNEEVEGLERKTTPKKLRASYRFLLDRAIELAAGEIQRFRDDQDAARRDRERGVEASQAAVLRATETLEEARTMQGRVIAAERSARQGLGMMVEKLTDS
ncbi:MAG: hypothetical protein LC679_14710 [Intrasporangiaceae bacterium]|nr:hypothetical protein [Intrasporangiaceae bacterium]